MAKYIDADALIVDFGFAWDDIMPTREELIEFIKIRPAADVEP